MRKKKFSFAKDLKRAMLLLSEDSKLEIIDGANNSFLENYDILIDLTNEWFIKHLCY